MRTCTLALILVLIGCGPEQPPEKPQTFLLMGQSNMVGSGRTAELSAADTTMPANVRYQEGMKVMRPWDTPRVGPELTLAQTLGAAFPGSNLQFVKHALGGTSLLAWAPEWDSTRAAITGNAGAGPMYDHALAIVDSLRAGLEVDVAAVFWMQGERDARFAEVGPAYFENLESLITALRRDLDSPYLPFIMGRVNAPADRYPALADVRAAQFRAVEEIPDVYLINTDDLSMHDDNLHYNTEGVKGMGRLFAEAFLALNE